jgi:prolyl oligopeptidase
MHFQGLPARILVSLLAITLLIGAAGGPPATKTRPVTDVYHGVKVIDPYRWLEDWDDPAVKAWSDAQNAYARSILDHLPGVNSIRQRVTQIRKINIEHYGVLKWAGSTLFALKFTPAKQQDLLVAMPSEDKPDSARVIVDPNILDPKSGTAIDWYVPSLDGKWVAVSLSEGGSERGNVHVYETATAKQIGEVIPRVNYGTAGGSLAWDHDGRGFFYTRYPREGERPAADLDFYTQVYYHQIGTATGQDRYEIGKDFPRIAEIQLRTSSAGRQVLANVANGDGGEFSQYLRTTDGRWTQLTTFADKVVLAVFGEDDALYLLSRMGAPKGKVLRLPLAGIDPKTKALAKSTVVVPQSEAVIESSFFGSESIVPTENRLFVVDQIGGPNQVRIFDLEGKELGKLPLPPISAVYQVTSLKGRQKDSILYQSGSFLETAFWHRFQPSAAGLGKTVRTALSQPFPIDFGDAEVVRELVPSKDGTRVPLNVIRPKKIVLNGKNPVLLTGYGGYDISLGPDLDPINRLWLDQGGVLAVANLRGGGEFGEDWHQAGNLTHKQNVFDDFIACAEYLIKSGYTSKEHLAIEGGSNGGLLMGAVITQRPELFKAVVSYVGDYDMLRVELSPNGAFNTTEFGTVKDPEQFRALYAYSPYHRVKDGVHYPAVLFLTGANDPRVDPMQSRKMTARLQAATEGKSMVLLRTSAGTGHGYGTSLDEQINEDVDVFAFLFSQLAIDYKPAERR